MQLIRYALVLLITSSGSFAEELPRMSSISAGQVEVSQSLNELVVRQTSDSGIINWDSFNVSKGAGVIFEQPSAKSITLNNILSAAPSLIDGRVTAPWANCNGGDDTLQNSVHAYGGGLGVNLPINDNLSLELVAAKFLDTNLSDQIGSPNYWVELSYNF